eukprot:13793626-Alexandrium_andersonii.AAC.1
MRCSGWRVRSRPMEPHSLQRGVSGSVVSSALRPNFSLGTCRRVARVPWCSLGAGLKPGLYASSRRGHSRCRYGMDSGTRVGASCSCVHGVPTGRGAVRWRLCALLH